MSLLEDAVAIRTRLKADLATTERMIEIIWDRNIRGNDRVKELREKGLLPFMPQDNPPLSESSPVNKELLPSD